jgi:hypothetical protein
MFFEMQENPRHANPNDLIGEFKNAEAKNFRALKLNPGKTKALKQLMLDLLIITVSKLNKKPRVSYRDFIPLYEIVKNSKLFNTQTHPRWDRFWRKHNTNTMQEALGIVRNAATDVLVEKADRLAPRAAGDFIDTALAEKIFSEPRSNWAVSDPTTFSYLQSKLLAFYSEDRHRRGIYTPPLPISQMNGWPHDLAPQYYGLCSYYQ